MPNQKETTYFFLQFLFLHDFINIRLLLTDAIHNIFPPFHINCNIHILGIWSSVSVNRTINVTLKKEGRKNMGGGGKEQDRIIHSIYIRKKGEEGRGKENNKNF